MKKLHITANEQNVLNTFCSNAIDRNPDVIYFCNLIATCEDCFSIAVDGQWGSGKTFFIKQVKLLLDYLNEHTLLNEDCTNKLNQYFDSKTELQEELASITSHATIYYDAWENDNDVDPILSLIYAVISTFQTNLEAKRRNVSEIVGSIVDLVTGKNVTAFFTAIKGEDPLQQIENDKSVIKLMNELLEYLIIEHGDRLVIFIDELDRCKPTFAVKLLERIKHFFTDDRVTFVFSVNIEQLQHTIKNYYGADFSASRYLDKFFDMRISLPDANYSKYFESIGFRRTNYIYDQMCELVIAHFDFKLREVSKYAQITKLAAYKPTHSNYAWSYYDEKALGFCLFYIVPILIGLQIHNMTMYTNCIQGHDSSEIIDVLLKYQYRLTSDSFLLSHGETFSTSLPSKDDLIIIDLKERLLEVYNAIFVDQYTPHNQTKIIGEMEFNADMKQKIIRYSSPFSPYATLDT